MVRWLALVAVTACYSPSYTTCAITCVATNACPSGLDCMGGVCVAPGQSCGSGDGDAMTDTGGSGSDAAVGPWGMIELVPLGAQLPTVDDPSLTDNLLEMYVNGGPSDIFRFQRATATDPWGPPQLVSELDSNMTNGSPDISSDGLEIVWQSNLNATHFELYVATRAMPNPTFSPPSLAPGVNSPSLDGAPALSKDRLTLVFHSDRLVGDPGALFLSTRSNTSPTVVWSAPIALTPPNDPSKDDQSPYLSADQLTIYFSSDRTGNYDLYYATRASAGGAFGAAMPITELNTPAPEGDPWVSADGRHIYFARVDGASVSSIFHATR